MLVMNETNIILELQPHHGVAPCLYGPTGSGKTSRIERFAAEKFGGNLKKLLPGTSLPEDILGIPRVSGKYTRWFIPEMFKEVIENRGVLFIDELDKAREETHAALLTLISSREIRGERLHPQTVIVCAMQPVNKTRWLRSETGAALSARLVFIRTKYERGRFLKFGVDLSGLPQPEEVEFPTLPYLSDRQAEFICHLADKLGIFTKSDIERPEYKTFKEIISGIVNPEMVDPIAEMFGNRGMVIQRNHQIFIENIEKFLMLDDETMAERFASAAGNHTFEVWFPAWKKFCSLVESGRQASVLKNFLERTQEMDIFPGSPQEDVEKVVALIFRALGGTK